MLVTSVLASPSVYPHYAATYPHPGNMAPHSNTELQLILAYAKIVNYFSFFPFPFSFNVTLCPLPKHRWLYSIDQYSIFSDCYAYFNVFILHSVTRTFFPFPLYSSNHFLSTFSLFLSLFHSISHSFSRFLSLFSLSFAHFIPRNKSYFVLVKNSVFVC